MSSKYWIKLYHEIIDDPKMGMMPELLFARCIKFLLLAGDNNKNGWLPSIEHMAWRLRIPGEELESDLIELQKIGITSHKEGDWKITKWAARQGPMPEVERSRRRRSEQQMQVYDEVGPAYMGGMTKETPELDHKVDRITVAEEESDIDKEPDIDKEATKKEICFNAAHKKFSSTSGIKEPWNQEKAKNAWWIPLQEIVEIAEYNMGRAEFLIERGLKRNRDRDLAIASPKSILSSINAIIAEESLPRKDDKPLTDKEWLKQNVRSNV